MGRQKQGRASGRAGITDEKTATQAKKQVKEEVEKRAKAMLAQEMKRLGYAAAPPAGGGKGGKWCKHCKAATHTDATCWKLHPEQAPNNQKGGGGGDRGWRGLTEGERGGRRGDSKKKGDKGKGKEDTGKGDGGEKQLCDICGKDNHDAANCFYRPVESGGKGKKGRLSSTLTQAPPAPVNATAFFSYLRVVNDAEEEKPSSSWSSGGNGFRRKDTSARSGTADAC